ncbi:MAG: tRNA (adenosine(37)-N6)-threonylcarbamoyltransferase complex dimerization subunit type 1 TsaB [Verrucomicrobiota bacterium]
MILAIETSTPNAHLAILSHEGDEVVFETRFHSDRAHNSRIFDPLASALEAANDLTRLAVGTGPGSYSGVRVGIAIANGLAVAKGIDVVGLPSISTLFAHGLVVGDARRNAFFVAGITDHQMTSPPEIQSADEFRETVSSALADGRSVASMDATPPLGITEIELLSPNATKLGILAAELDVSDQAIEPVYVREPYITKEKPKVAPG